MHVHTYIHKHSAVGKQRARKEKTEIDLIILLPDAYRYHQANNMMKKKKSQCPNRESTKLSKL